MADTPEQIIAAYRAAYLHANGFEPNVFYSRGWYAVTTYGPLPARYRARDILSFTERLNARPKAPSNG